MTDRPNIFDRATELARAGHRVQDIIKRLKSERYDSVDDHLSPSVRKKLRDERNADR